MELDVETENINNFVPPVLHPHAIHRTTDPNFSQISTTRRFSLSLKKKPRQPLKEISDTQLSTTSRFSLSLKKKPRQALEEITDTQSLSRSNISEQKLNIQSELQQNQRNPTILSDKRSVNCEVEPTEGNFRINPQLLNKQHTNNFKIHKSTLSFSTFLTAGDISEKSLENADEVQTQLNIPKNVENNKMNIECLSIHSFGTKLCSNLNSENFELPESDKSLTSQEISNSVRTDEKLLISVSKNRISTKRLSVQEHEEIKKRKDSQDLVLVLNNKVIKEYSKIVFEPTNIKMYRRNDKKRKAMRNQKKITRFFKNTAANKKLSENISSDDDCVFVSEERVIDSNLESPEIKRPSKSIESAVNPQKVCSNKELQNTSIISLITPKSISKTSSSSSIPPHKIIPGTRFAVDAFCYGDIPNVSTYFLTHFHSDHYMGLRKSFHNTLYCTKITAELCQLKLCVNQKCIRIIEPDQTVVIDGVQVTALDANHCPGAIMLLFSLPSGTNILHCGDFRASYAMESNPVFWSKDIHTVYLDTTYCNPRYDFPTQEESVQMAVDTLKRKKASAERRNEDFSRVLIVCGTYTIGKEKFFIGLSEYLCCLIWTKKEKAAVLQRALGKNFSNLPPQKCQMHVLEMRLLTHKDLKCHLESMGGAFSEVIAFKPSGWEAGKSASQEDNITIHGIPYSEHSSFSEMLRFVKFLQPKLVIPTVPIPGGIKAVQKYFPCPLSTKEDSSQKRISDYFTKNRRTAESAVT